MSTQQVRQPALQRRVDPLAEAIPDRVHADTAVSPAPAATQPAAASPGVQRGPLNTSLQVRVQATTRTRLEQAVRKLAVDRNQSVSMSGLIDEIADTYLTQHGF